MYDPDKSEQPAQGYESDAARAMNCIMIAGDFCSVDSKEVYVLV